MPEEIVNPEVKTAPKAKSATATLEPPAPEYKQEDPNRTIVWLFKPNANYNAPVNIQFPPDERSRNILADINVPKGMSSLPLKSEWLNFGPNQLPIATVRAIQSHPESAAHVEHLIREGVLEILTADFSDVDGISNDRAMSIHFTVQKAIALVNASYDKEELAIWQTRESLSRPEVARAIAARLKALKEDEEESRKSAEREHVDTV